MSKNSEKFDKKVKLFFILSSNQHIIFLKLLFFEISKINEISIKI